VVERIDVEVIFRFFCLSQPQANVPLSVEIGQSEIIKSAPLSAQGFRFQRHDIPHVNHNPIPEIDKMDGKQLQLRRRCSCKFSEDSGPCASVEKALTPKPS